jgi:DNA-binding MarR family transcriptional regulator
MHCVSSSRPQLAPIFRSETQLQIMALVYLEPERHFAVADVVTSLDASQATVAREVDRLVAAGLLETELVRGRRSVWAASDSPIFFELHSLLLKTVGPKPVIEEELAGLAGVLSAMIYGSWARRFAGESGPVPADIDLLLVGDIDVPNARASAERASERLGRDVNVTVVSRLEWESAETGFLRELHGGALVELAVERDGERNLLDRSKAL